MSGVESVSLCACGEPALEGLRGQCQACWNARIRAEFAQHPERFGHPADAAARRKRAWR